MEEDPVVKIENKMEIEEVKQPQNDIQKNESQNIIQNNQNCFLPMSKNTWENFWKNEW